MSVINTYSEEKIKTITQAVERLVFFTNKVLNEWDTIRQKSQATRNYDETRGLFRGHIRRYLNSVVDFRLLSSLEFSINICGMSKALTSITCFNQRAYSSTSHLEELLNGIFKSLDYKALAYTVAKDEEMRNMPTRPVPIVNQELVLGESSIDYAKLESFKF